MNFCKVLVLLCAAIALTMAVGPNNVVQAQDVGQVVITSLLAQHTVNVEVCTGGIDERRGPAVIYPHGTYSWEFQLSQAGGGWNCNFYMNADNKVYKATVHVWPSSRVCSNCQWTIRTDGFYRLLSSGGWTLVTRWHL